MSVTSGNKKNPVPIVQNRYHHVFAGITKLPGKGNIHVARFMLIARFALIDKVRVHVPHVLPQRVHWRHEIAFLTAFNALTLMPLDPVAKVKVMFIVGAAF